MPEKKRAFEKGEPVFVVAPGHNYVWVKEGTVHEYWPDRDTVDFGPYQGRFDAGLVGRSREEAIRLALERVSLEKERERQKYERALADFQRRYDEIRALETGDA